MPDGSYALAECEKHRINESFTLDSMLPKECPKPQPKCAKLNCYRDPVYVVIIEMKEHVFGWGGQVGRSNKFQYALPTCRPHTVHLSFTRDFNLPSRNRTLYPICAEMSCLEPATRWLVADLREAWVS